MQLTEVYAFVYYIWANRKVCSTNKYYYRMCRVFITT